MKISNLKLRLHYVNILVSYLKFIIIIWFLFLNPRWIQGPRDV